MAFLSLWLVADGGMMGLCGTANYRLAHTSFSYVGQPRVQRESGTLRNSVRI